MQKVLKTYLKRLTNLSSSNRSLLMLKLSPDQDFDLNALDFLKPSFKIIEDLIAGKNKIELCDVQDSRNATINELSKTLRRIDRKEKFVYEERGSKDLYIGWPFVRGKLMDETCIAAPLLFFPVTLLLENNKWFVVQRKDVSISFNKSFLLAYSYYNKISLTEEFTDTSFEDTEADSKLFRTDLYQLLKENLPGINFNQDLFIDKTSPFFTYKKEAYEEIWKTGELRLFPEAVLGMFPEAGSYLVPDYNTIMAGDEFASFEDFFYSKSVLHEVNKSKEEYTFTPFKLDASQELAVKAVKNGNSVVIQGPPGAGKSQLISNLIADYIARGKKVLLVSQKRAALDVVHSRMGERGLDEFCALVHDFKNDRSKLFEQISSQIQKIEEYKFRNNSLDAIQLERNFISSARTIEQITEELQEFKDALFNDSECGISIKELYLSSNPHEATVNLKQEYNYFKKAQIEEFSSFLKKYLPYSFRLELTDSLWKERVSFKDFTVRDFKEILRLLDHIPYYQADISEKVREIFEASLDFEDFEWFLGRHQQIADLLTLLEDEKIYSYFGHQVNKNTTQDWFVVKVKQIREAFSPIGVEESLDVSQLSDLQKALDKVLQTHNQPHKWLWWKLFSKEKYTIKRLLVANGLKWTKEGIGMLSRKIDNRMNLEHVLTEFRESSWLKDVPEERELAILEEWINCQHQGLMAKELFFQLRNLKDILNASLLSFEEFHKKINAFIEVVSEIPEERKSWRNYLVPGQITKLLSAYEYSIDLQNSLKDQFESLVEFDKMKATLSTTHQQLVEKLIDNDKDKTVESVIALFQNSIRIEWIDHIEQKYPVLRSVSSLKMEQMEKELREEVKQKLAYSKEMALMLVRELTYKNIKTNRLNNVVTYRDLKHQAGKKKKLWTLRKVIENFGEELFDLVPCWMASPETVSAIFPMNECFDLVIFDEASQCFAEKSIPSLYRAKQVVIAGDSKQLKPHELYQVRWEDEFEDSVPELETDSLLDVASHYLASIQLNGHYRSKALELIQFSNHHFYNDTLTVIPAPEHINSPVPAIEYIKVNGVWDSKKNEEEADAIAKLLQKLVSEDASKSIGIITFNYHQQEYIQDVVENHFFAKKLSLPDSLFIKNIENVQGNETDIIIFSIGYAPNAQGKFNLHFGSLNSAGGENRLNVAVTRAREKIYLVTSILPTQLATDSTAHSGPKLLKKYLEYSYAISQGDYRESLKEFERAYFSRTLANELLQVQELPLLLSHELPFSDLTVKLSSTNYKGLILTDDNNYYSAVSVKDSHAYTPLMLEEKHWKYRQVYSRQWWQDREKVREDILKSFIND